MTNKEAIKILEEMPISSNVHFEEIAEAIEIAIKALEERPHGKWIDNGSAGYYGEREWYCSSCKFRWIMCKKEELDPDWCFCPTCGADMRGDDNETDN